MTLDRKGLSEGDFGSSKILVGQTNETHSRTSPKKFGGNEVLPKFCDVYLNHDFIVHFGYDKKIV